ncbi:translation initiation factor IF-1 [Candidatus Gracilibacteria bacterium]|nr:MAG: translation initiation factor IF-1 [Candidatus Gracilibacteria bacterium]PIE85049.1 MAG: translation initiation factor IF-1 [Candidatus Gracilibacteria bacterium]
MSNKEDKIEVEGVVLKALPGLVFDIQLPEQFGGGVIQGYLSGKMRNNYIRPIEGDTVLVELSIYDLTKGRIIFRK